MTVQECMTKHPITCRESDNMYEVSELMEREAVHHLPVLDSRGKLVGVISEKDIITAVPDLSSKPSLSKMAYLISKLTVKDVMSSEIATIDPSAPIEQAAKEMFDKEVSCLPVVFDQSLVGLITKSDMFSLLLELFGARHYGVRVTMRVKDKPGTIAEITSELAKRGIDIVSIGTIRRTEEGICTLKVQGESKDNLKSIFDKLGAEVLDIREV